MMIPTCVIVTENETGNKSKYSSYTNFDLWPSSRGTAYICGRFFSPSNLTAMATGFSRIVNQLGYKRKLLPNGCMRVIVPGLPYTAFDGFEHPQPWSVANILDSVQISAVHLSPHDNVGSLLDMHQVFSTSDTLIAASKIVFCDEMYNKGIVKSPLYVDNRVSHVGKTTLVIDSEMRTENTVLATLRQLQIFLDKKNRRPVLIPDWWKEQFGNMIGAGEPIRFPVLTKPSTNVTRVSIGEVPYSDTDAFFHVNFSNYLKYCINGIFKDRKNTAKPLLIKSAFTWYRRECYLGDDLEIDYWSDPTSPDILCIDMLKGHSSVVQCRLGVY